tara:strand:+ start:20 stop:223 length:204 start_codon:yes stop_codon:yes gene_type:complete
VNRRVKMSNDINTAIKYDIVDNLASMSVDEFCNLCEKHNIKDIVPDIDSAIDELAQTIFDEREDYYD